MLDRLLGFRNIGIDSKTKSLSLTVAELSYFMLYLIMHGGHVGFQNVERMVVVSKHVK